MGETTDAAEGLIGADSDTSAAVSAGGHGADEPNATAGGAVAPLTLTIPARNDYLRFARLMAVGLATRLDFDYDTVEDLRLAVSELCTALVTACGEQGQIALTYQSDGIDSLVIGAAATYAPGVRGGTTPDELLAPILDSVAEAYQLDLGDAGGTFLLRMRAGSARAS